MQKIKVGNVNFQIKQSEKTSLRSGHFSKNLKEMTASHVNMGGKCLRQRQC